MKDYLSANKLVLLIVISALVMGITLGASMVVRVSPEEADELYASINESVSQASLFSSFLKALVQESTSFFILFICGVTIAGAPAAVFYIGMKGYAIGFTVGFLIKYYGLVGLLSAVGGILPHYIILIPAFVCMGIIGINFSNRLLRGDKNLRENLRSYIAKGVLIAVFILFGCVVEGFISSFLLKKILAMVI